MMDLGLEGKVFVITAASSGLGLASARELVAEGARVVLVARRAQVLDELAAELGAATVAGDLVDPDLPARAVQVAIDRFGRVDGALVSVGGPPKGSVLENSDEQWRAAFDSVFLPALRVARAVLAENEAARLGFVLSSSAKSPLPTMAISNGLRPGLAMLVKQLADEIGPRGGRAFALLPGNIATDRLVGLYGPSTEPGSPRATVTEQIPLRRLGEPTEFGRVACFMLSEAAAYMTGCVVPVDGGLLRAL